MSKSHQQGGRTLKPRLSIFARNLLEEWRQLELPLSEASVVVAVSGGADSTALLLGLDEIIKANKLRLELIVAHLDHGLRDESRNDAKWVAQLAKQLGYKTEITRANVKKSTRLKTKVGKSKENLEQAARNARYTFLEK